MESHCIDDGGTNIIFSPPNIFISNKEVIRFVYINVLQICRDKV